jgi:hypothetical protein
MPGEIALDTNLWFSGGAERRPLKPVVSQMALPLGNNHRTRQLDEGHPFVVLDDLISVSGR